MDVWRVMGTVCKKVSNEKEHLQKNKVWISLGGDLLTLGIWVDMQVEKLIYGADPMTGTEDFVPANFMEKFPLQWKRVEAMESLVSEAETNPKFAMTGVKRKMTQPDEHKHGESCGSNCTVCSKFWMHCTDHVE